MKFPFQPTAVFNVHGGQVIEVTGVGHRIVRPDGGYSRDYWFYTGTVKWEDTGKTSEGHIDAGFLCADTVKGQEEIRDMSVAMMEYLNANGVWSAEGKPQGWYANDRKKHKASGT